MCEEHGFEAHFLKLLLLLFRQQQQQQHQQQRQMNSALEVSASAQEYVRVNVNNLKIIKPFASECLKYMYSLADDNFHQDAQIYILFIPHKRKGVREGGSEREGEGGGHGSLLRFLA